MKHKVGILEFMGVQKKQLEVEEEITSNHFSFLYWTKFPKS